MRLRDKRNHSVWAREGERSSNNTEYEAEEANKIAGVECAYIQVIVVVTQTKIAL